LIANLIAIGYNRNAHRMLEKIAGSGKRKDIVIAGSFVPRADSSVVGYIGIIEFEYVSDSRESLRFTCIDAGYFSVSVRRRQDLGVKHSGQINIPGKNRFAAYPLMRVLPGYFAPIVLYIVRKFPCPRPIFIHTILLIGEASLF
jgi:hypothetical protein